MVLQPQLAVASPTLHNNRLSCRLSWHCTQHSWRAPNPGSARPGGGGGFGSRRIRLFILFRGVGGGNTEMDHIVGGKFKLGKKIGSGSSGELFLDESPPPSLRPGPSTEEDACFLTFWVERCSLCCSCWLQL
jgi:hypothetical protein